MSFFRATIVTNEEMPALHGVSRESAIVESSMSIATLEPFVDAVAAGGFLGLHPVTVQRLAREGRLPGHSVSHGNGVRMHWRFLLSELAQWLKSRDAGSAGTLGR
jgi:hypothetical protein